MDLAELLDHISSQTQVTDQANHKGKKISAGQDFSIQ
jgi:hypothetical protein